MALKKKITKDEYSKLPKDVQKEYTESGDEYELDVDGLEDAGALRRAKDREAQKAKDEKKRADELQIKLEELEGNDARKQGDIVRLEAQWKEKSENEKKTLTDKLTKRDTFIREKLLDGTAESLAKTLAGDDKFKILLPHVKDRLTVDLDAETPTLKILDGDKKPSNLTLEDLEKEFRGNDTFSSIIVGSRASGSSAGGKRNGAGTGKNGNGGSSSGGAEDFAKMGDKERTELFKSNPERFKQLNDELQASLRKF